MHKPPLIVILGPTAAGKTKLAVSLAAHFNGEIISADSRQVFKDMDIGTGKDLGTYQIEDRKIPYHLIDIRAAGETYHVNAFKEDFYTAFQSITAKGKTAFLCGGTGMYIHSVLQHQPHTAIPVNETLRAELLLLSKEELQLKVKEFPESEQFKIDFSSVKRLIRAIEIATYLRTHTLEDKVVPLFEPIVIGLTNSTQLRWENISKRLEERLAEGLIAEVEALIEKGVGLDRLTFYGLEYKFVAAYLNQEYSYSTFKEKLTISIRQYAKRQLTFFRKMEKDGVVIHWFDTNVEFETLKKEVVQKITSILD